MHLKCTSYALDIPLLQRLTFKFTLSLSLKDKKEGISKLNAPRLLQSCKRSACKAQAQIIQVLKKTRKEKVEKISQALNKLS